MACLSDLCIMSTAVTFVTLVLLPQLDYKLEGGSKQGEEK